MMPNQSICTLFLVAPPPPKKQGEESVKERFTLDESKVVPFLEQEYTLEQVRRAVLQYVVWGAIVNMVLAAS
jgi:hypothetical protein